MFSANKIGDKSGDQNGACFRFGCSFNRTACLRRIAWDAGSPELRAPIDYSNALEPANIGRQRSHRGRQTRSAEPRRPFGTSSSTDARIADLSNKLLVSTHSGTGLPEYVGGGCADSVCTIGTTPSKATETTPPWVGLRLTSLVTYRAKLVEVGALRLITSGPRHSTTFRSPRWTLTEHLIPPRRCSSLPKR